MVYHRRTLRTPQQLAELNKNKIKQYRDQEAALYIQIHKRGNGFNQMYQEMQKAVFKYGDIVREKLPYMCILYDLRDNERKVIAMHTNYEEDMMNPIG